MKRLVSPTGKPILLDAVRPNLGLQAAYRRKLDRLIEAMQRSLVYWLRATYRAKPPELAQDAPDGGSTGKSPAMNLRDEMASLGARWQAQFDQAAPDLAEWFAKASFDRSDRALKAILDKAGFTVEFKMTRNVNDVFQATVGEQVGLIKSIASEHLTQVQGLVMRSVQQGRDLGFLSKELQARLGVTKRRAALISRDQSNKATATITRVRQQELGITTAQWMHSAGGKEPRPEHVAANGKTYDIAKGMYLEGEWVWPGTAINCRCVSKAIVKGFD